MAAETCYQMDGRKFAHDPTKMHAYVKKFLLPLAGDQNKYNLFLELYQPGLSTKNVSAWVEPTTLEEKQNVFENVFPFLLGMGNLPQELLESRVLEQMALLDYYGWLSSNSTFEPTAKNFKLEGKELRITVGESKEPEYERSLLEKFGFTVHGPAAGFIVTAFSANDQKQVLQAWTLRDYETLRDLLLQNTGIELDQIE